MPRITSAALFFGAAMLTSLAHAETPDQAWAYCNNDQNALSADLQIEGCTDVIQNAWGDQRNLAIAFYNRGEAYQNGHDYARAIADYTQAIALNPRDTAALNNRGLAYKNAPEHDYQRAIADFSQALALDPANVDALNNRGVAYKNEHNYQLAIADFTRAISLDPWAAAPICRAKREYRHVASQRAPFAL